MGGWGGDGQFSDLRGKGACHDITKSADFHTNINLSENDCIIAEILQKRYQTNDFRLRILRNKKVFEKTQIGWRQMRVASS